LDVMEKSVASTEVEAVSRALGAATVLKGASGNLGARNLAALADEVIQAVHTGYLSESLPLVQKARDEFERARDALGKIKGETKPEG
jgi:HPt (histidine-containing phosphotransfer) domain-containing protein